MIPRLFSSSCAALDRINGICFKTAQLTSAGDKCVWGVVAQLHAPDTGRACLFLTRKLGPLRSVTLRCAQRSCLGLTPHARACRFCQPSLFLTVHTTPPDRSLSRTLLFADPRCAGNWSHAFLLPVSHRCPTIAPPAAEALRVSAYPHHSAPFATAFFRPATPRLNTPHRK